MPVEHRLGPVVLLLGVREVDAEPLEVGLRPDNVGVLLLDLGLDQRRVEPRDDLSLVDDRVEVGVELLDRAGHLGADIHGLHGLERAGRRNGVDDVTPGTGMVVTFGSGA